MIGIAILVAFTSLGIYIGYSKQKEKERSAEATFKATMLALEEKAKREGTFKVSYFDKEQK